jgi:hypothetical protein
MKRSTFVPELFEMAPPFPDMNGSLLRLTQGDTSESVAMLTTVGNGKFGIRLDLIAFIEPDRITVQMVSLDKSEIMRITKVDGPIIQFELRL